MNHQEEWRRLNNTGDGFDPQLGMTVRVVVWKYEEQGATVLFRGETTSDVSVVQTKDGAIVGIGGDSVGRMPWAIVLQEGGTETAVRLGSQGGRVDAREARENGATPAALDAGQLPRRAYRHEAREALQAMQKTGEVTALVSDEQKDAYVEAYRLAYHEALLT